MALSSLPNQNPLRAMLRPTRYPTLFLALLLLLLAAPVTTHAQRGTRSTTVAPRASSTDGLFLHARADGHGIAFEDAGDDTGATLGLRAGYGVSDRVTLYLGLEGADLDGGSRLPGLETDETSDRRSPITPSPRHLLASLQWSQSSPSRSRSKWSHAS